MLLPCSKLQTEFAITDKYVEVSVDVGSSSAAAYITGLVRGATKALVIDIGLVLEGQHSYELPEELLGACRWVEGGGAQQRECQEE